MHCKHCKHGMHRMHCKHRMHCMHCEWRSEFTRFKKSHLKNWNVLLLLIVYIQHAKKSDFQKSPWPENSNFYFPLQSKNSRLGNVPRYTDCIWFSTLVFGFSHAHMDRWSPSTIWFSLRGRFRSCRLAGAVRIPPIGPQRRAPTFVGAGHLEAKAPKAMFLVRSQIRKGYLQKGW